MAPANSFKPATLLWLVAGLLIPLWPVSLPFCWYMAHRSYKSGSVPPGSLSDLQAAAALKQAGVLSDAEFAAAKTRALGTRDPA